MTTTNTTSDGHDCRSFEHSIIQSLLDLEHARVEAKKQIELAHLRADLERDIEARAAEQRDREELAHMLKPLVDACVPALVAMLSRAAVSEGAKAEEIDLTSPDLDDDA